MPATVQNSGWEVRCLAKILETQLIKLSVNFNIGANRNKLLAFPDIENTSYANQFLVGQALNMKYLLKFTGVDPTTGKYSYEDKNKDGTLNSTPSPLNPDVYGFVLDSKYFGGMGMNVSIKSISINTFFTFAKTPYVQKAVYNSVVPGNFGRGNQSIRALNRWMKPGDDAEFARYTTRRDRTDLLFTASDGIFSNGSYIRFQNVSVNYVLPKQLLTKIKFQNASLFVRAENILVITKYDGLDPVVNGLGGYPPPFILTFGATLSL
jgi:hypothetical protein